jgi:hypothetical protein
MTRLFRLSILLFILLVIAGCDAEQNNADAGQPSTSPVAENEPGTSIDTGSQPPEASARQPGDPLPSIRSASDPDDGFQEMQWEDLMPADFRPENILEKYEEELEELEQLDDFDPKAMEIFETIQAEMNNAPVNEDLDGKKVKLPGFIAPLENVEDKVTEFLLVPYFGACIHVPPPPINQTVMVKTRSGEGIPSAESHQPYWIKGVITTKGEATGIGSAGYRIEQATTELFE